MFKLTVLLLLSLAGCVAASSNNLLDESSVRCEEVRLPNIEVSDLEGNEYKLPVDFDSDFTVLVFGFAHAQKEAVKAWITELKANSGKYPQFKYYKVPVIDSSNAALRMMIRNGMSMGAADSETKLKTLTLFIEKLKFINKLCLQDESQVVAALFNRSGVLIEKEIGDVNPTKIETLLRPITTPIKKE